MQISISRFTWLTLLALIMPVIAAAQSGLDSTGYTFRGDNKSSEKKFDASGLVFRGDAQSSNDSNGTDKERVEERASKYKFRPPRVRRTVRDQVQAQRNRCIEPEREAPQAVTPFSYPSKSPYLYQGYRGSYGDPGNYIPGYNRYPGSSFPKW